jgi:hypothetical protein
MPINTGAINSHSINAALAGGLEGLNQLAAYTILGIEGIPGVVFRGRLQAVRIFSNILPPAWLFVEGVLSVDYAVSTDPTFLKPPERGGIR